MKTLPVNVKQGFDFSQVDPVLTTAKKHITNNPNTDIIQISPLMTSSDYRSIEAYIQGKRISRLCRIPYPTITEFLKHAYFTF